MSGLFELYEKYSGYYDLCEEGRNVIKEAAEKICANANLSEEAMRIKNKLADLSFYFTEDEFDTEFKDKSAQFGAFVYTLAIEDMEKIYQEKNIPHDILIDTVSDLAVWINRHHDWVGEWGFSQYGWLIHHIRGRLFKLGRLQFELPKVFKQDSVPGDFKIDLKDGDMFLNTHIPRGGRLDEASCLDSFERAKEFFPKFLNCGFKAFGCFTWLFDPAFENLLPSDSNILKFQKLFKIYPGHESYGGLEYVFINITKDNIKDAPTDTLFRKNLVEHILSGGIMQSGGGFRLV
ncbi:MAG: acyltransferase domain-containing protein [Oscillospiraceae bacterium]|nr:acyltransferase domain-containing protein [Oscillospiraceae bacterium]